jgi:hypothetical protein
MFRLTKLTWLMTAIILSGLTACGGGTPTTDPSQALTQIWKAVEVAQTQTAQAVSPTPSVTNTPVASPTLQATITPLLTNTPKPGTPSATPITISTSSGTQSASVDNALGIADVTYPDNSEVVPGASFVKTWQVQNLGPSTWNKNYRLIFGWGGVGTNWKTTAASYFTTTVLPGEKLEISVTLKAPTEAGTYSAAFRLQNDQGYNFGPAQTVIVVVK